MCSLRWLDPKVRETGLGADVDEETDRAGGGGRFGLVTSVAVVGDPIGDSGEGGCIGGSFAVEAAQDVDSGGLPVAPTGFEPALPP
jgi:hypothetical protein